MTVAALSTYPVQYNCNGVLDEFPFDFNVNSGSDVEVILTDSEGAETVLVETTDYSVSATNDDFSSGGTVTTVGIYESGNTLTIRMAVAITQASAFTENMATLYETFESGLDKLTRICQQLDEAIGRSLSFKKSSSYKGEGLFPDPSDGLLLGWDGTELVNMEFTETGNLTLHASDAQAHNKSAESVTIGVSGILDLSSFTDENYFSVSSESGTNDSLVSISGLSAGALITLEPASGHTITVEAGSLIKMNNDFVMDSPYDEITLRAISGGAVKQVSRSSNA